MSRKLGVWISDKKSQKLNWKEMLSTCAAHGFEMVKLDLSKPLDEQGEIDVLLHKLTDVIAADSQGDAKASAILGQVEQYLSNHPNTVVIDPLDNVRILLNRFNYYDLVSKDEELSANGIFTPAFAEFTTDNINDKIELMRQRNVKFPIVCKPTLAHGSKLAHQMIVVFSEDDLRVCKPPCVVQNFVNHNAVLHKVFVVGNRYHICRRPSLKNFYASDGLQPIFYSTGEVCKADSQSTLSILDPHDQSSAEVTLDEDKIKCIIKFLRRTIGLLLVGFDIVIDNTTGRHAVIDINVFPSYDNFPNFFENLLECINIYVCERKVCDRNGDGDIVHRKLNGLVNVGLTSRNSRVTGMNV